MLVCACLSGKGQINLVHNPSFEDYWRCPQYMDLVKYSNYWSSINDTVVSDTDTLGFPPYYYCLPEYCNKCSSYPVVGIPNATAYTQYPRTGNGMMQVRTYYNEEDSTSIGKRDYLQGRLKESLSTGSQYCVNFYVCFEGSSRSNYLFTSCQQPCFVAVMEHCV